MELVKSEFAFFEMFGYTPDSRTWSPLIEFGPGDGEVYVKFMSNGGMTDNEQGLAFGRFLDREGAVYWTSRLRSYSINDKGMRARIEGVL